MRRFYCKMTEQADAEPGGSSLTEIMLPIPTDRERLRDRTVSSGLLAAACGSHFAERPEASVLAMAAG